MNQCETCKHRFNCSNRYCVEDCNRFESIEPKPQQQVQQIHGCEKNENCKSWNSGLASCKWRKCENV